ncbi:MAG: hypothetical protein PWQ82_833 [Thermosediminibacterales bacterium]|nr:hypothetical protein [Thermosediminibacterales bacterium]MDK2835920.1 hypothetical protein [Thermosediminibacterales bacterium]
MNKKILIIGGVAAGTKAASKVKRDFPDSQVTIITKGEHISYAGCGLPYFLGKVIKEKKELVVRTPEEFKNEQGIDVLVKHEAVKVLPEEKKVIVKNLETGEEKEFEYDKLVLATGADPFIPPIKGVDLENIFTLRTVTDALKIRKLLDEGKVKKAVIVGAGLIGLETAENLTHRGVKVSVIELLDQILPPFDREIALLAQKHLNEKGVDIHTSEKVTSFVKNENSKEIIVKTDKGEIPADLVIMSVGVRPNIKLAKDMGLKIGKTGAIKVNEFMETSMPDIYAVGDCAESKNVINNEPAWIPLGSTANKAGRTTGLNLMGTNKNSFKGVLGTSIVKLFDLNLAKTGLSEKDAAKYGFDIETVIVPAFDKAHYFPGNKLIITKLIADKKDHRVLGAQIIGEGVVDKPIDIIATAIHFGAKVEDLTQLDLAYAPPFSMAVASTITAAHVMLNKLEGKVKTVKAHEILDKLNDENVQVIDIREEPEFIIRSIPGSINIPQTELLKRAASLGLDRNKETILVCKVGKRAYMTYCTLKYLGFDKVSILEGGITAYPFELE